MYAIFIKQKRTKTVAQQHSTYQYLKKQSTYWTGQHRVLRVGRHGRINFEWRSRENVTQLSVVYDLVEWVASTRIVLVHV